MAKIKISDLNTDGIAEGSSVVINDGAPVWGSPVAALADLTDVDLSGPLLDGYVMIWDDALGKFTAVELETVDLISKRWMVSDVGTGDEQTVTLPVAGYDPTDVLVFVNGIRWEPHLYSIREDELIITTRAEDDSISVFFAGNSGEGNFSFSGARVGVEASVLQSVISTTTPIMWGIAHEDTDGFWSSLTPDRFVIPDGVTRVRLSVFVKPHPDNGMSGNNMFTLMKNGVAASGNGGFDFALPTNNYTNSGATASSTIMDVSAGDYFQISYYIGDSFLLSNASWFAIEVIERAASNASLTIPLSSLTDVAVNPVDGDVLVYDGGARRWKSQTVSATVSASHAAFKGALTKLSVSRNVTGSPAIIQWDGTDYDSNGCWSAASPTRLTVPTGVTKIRLSAGLNGDGFATNYSVHIIKNGSTSAWVGQPQSNASNGYSDVGCSISSPVVRVTAGDYFEVRYNSTDTDRTFNAASYFAMEIVEVVS